MAHRQLKTQRVWAGPVHSGKSKKALTVAKRMVRLGADLVLVRPKAARRDHDRWPAIELDNPRDILAACEGADVLWIDEPSLFEEDEELVYPMVQAAREKVDVLVSGVPATSELEVFKESMCKIMAVADEIIWCRADCDSCSSFDKATRSFYLHGEKKQQVHVGGEEDYAALTAGTRKRR